MKTKQLWVRGAKLGGVHPAVARKLIRAGDAVETDRGVELQEASEALESAWEDIAWFFARNEEYYRSVLLQIAEYLGPDVYVCDDGSISESPLIAKIPELVESLAQERTK